MSSSDFVIDSVLEEIKKHFYTKLENAKTEEEQQEVLKEFKDFDVEGMINDSVDLLKDRVWEHVIDDRFENVLLFRQEEQHFLSSHNYKWNNGFVASEALYLFAIDCISQYKEIVMSIAEDDRIHESKYLAISFIAARACRQYLEIITLVRGGLADGATARWRSLYELSIITSFITEQDDDVAEAFIKQEPSDDYYEWARTSGLFEEKKIIRLGDIRKSCVLNTEGWTEQYKSACANIHPTAEATFDILGMPYGKMDVVPLGRTDYGVDNPAVFSAYSLSQILIMYLNIYPNATMLSAMKVLMDFVPFLVEEYKKDYEGIEWDIMETAEEINE